MTGQALSLHEGAARLVDLVVDETPIERELPVRRQSAEIVSLEDAASIIAGRMKPERQPATPAKAKPVKQRTQKLDEAADILAERMQPAVTVEVDTEIRQMRGHELAALDACNEVRTNLAWDLQRFIGQVAEAFPDVGGDPNDVLRLEATRGAQFIQCQIRARELLEALEQANGQSFESWNRVLAVEDIAFRAQHPDWSQEDAQRIIDMLEGFGLGAEELVQLWTAPIAIDIHDPRVLEIVKFVAGGDDRAQMLEVFESVGFDEREVMAVMSGQRTVHLRDVRLQEILCLAAART